MDAACGNAPACEADGQIAHEGGWPAAYIDDKLQIGDVLDVSAARGSFTLRPSDAPVVFLSAGIGATPVLAMLHALAAAASPREVWWLYGARDRQEHPFAEETRTLLKARSGLNVRWGPAFQSLLELAEACDVPVRWGRAGPGSATLARQLSARPG